MVELRILPRAANAFNVQLINIEGEVIGELEFNSYVKSMTEAHLSILRRENNFTPFTVTNQETFPKEPDKAFSTYSLNLMVKKTKRQLKRKS